ncbi:EmrA/EmrK family multidrug efflux transporter periplasmic adaptor subunit [Comamonas serinivorans]|uniref:EmrA/EmrK family multidrug efflux transporter periplasmic adaptor subunit n=1 Tax=Comamonas serinivorans TaxID=1082851 RepID=A0A1Y0EL38_9BURK|nr:HlyD family efflux transporter periplasmic adaptor subunit [Comamonas serinivorans]ARU04161.1 EmrA/EmrK family multidrug efflux transporter periplasmic adaptor subunit [Comamonas serinivorans]
MSDSTLSPEAPRARKRGLVMLGTAVVLAGAAWGVYSWLHGRHVESTDNAYVGGNVVQITSQVSGTVIGIYADNNDTVTLGQPLLKLDATDAKVNLMQAEAQLAQAVRNVRGLFANTTTLQSQIAARQADLARMQSDLSKAEADVKRRETLVKLGAVGREEFDHSTAGVASSRSALEAARAAVQTARDQLAASRVNIDGTDVASHPDVQRAAASLHAAYLALLRAELPAPIDGQVSQRNVQVGQRIEPGSALMSVVSLNDLWVDANFKESQLGEIRIGQAVTLFSDVYGKDVVYHGKVTGLGAGTGSAFSLLPAQNATGNWIKIVQRVPVRISLDPRDLQAHPLRIGLSMTATVDTRDTGSDAQAAVTATPAPTASDAASAAAPVHAGSAPLPSGTAPGHRPVASTAVYDAMDQAADEHVQAIIRANLRGAP